MLGVKSVSGLQGTDDPAGPRITIGGDECFVGERESRFRCPGSLLGGAVLFLFPRGRVTTVDRRLLYMRNGVLEADAILDPPWLSRALSFNAAATTSADDSAGRFDGLKGWDSFDAGYSLRNEHDGDGDAAEGSAEPEDRLICRLSFSM